MPRLLLPASAVTLLNGRTSVFLRTAQGFEARAIDTRQRADGRVEVTAGLQAGESAAMTGAYALKSRALKATLARDTD